MAYNGTGKTEWVSKSREFSGASRAPALDVRQLAAAIAAQTGRTAPVMTVERQYVNSGVDLDLVLRQAAFRERMGSF